MDYRDTLRIPWVIIASATLMAFAMWTPMYCVPPIEHILKEQLSLTHAQTSLLYSGPILVIAAISIPAGILTDRIGVRRAAGIGAIILAAGSALRAIATDSASLLAFTFIYGIGLGWSFPNLPKLVSLWTSRDRVGTITSIYMLGLYSGPALALALTVVAALPITGTYQGVFLIWSIPAIAATVMWWIFVREPPPPQLIQGNPNTGDFQRGTLFKNRNLWLLSTVALLQFFVFYAWTGWAPTLLVLKGASASLAGFIASITIWTSIPVVFFMPKLSSKIGLRKPLIWGPGIAFMVASLLAINVGLSFSWLPMALVGFADAALLITLVTMIVEIFDTKQVGSATGILWTLGHVGGFIGPLVGGHILDDTGDLRLSLIILAIMSAALIIVASRLPETTKHTQINYGSEP
jgi:cyanate permease